ALGLLWRGVVVADELGRLEAAEVFLGDGVSLEIVDARAVEPLLLGAHLPPLRLMLDRRLGLTAHQLVPPLTKHGCSLRRQARTAQYVQPDHDHRSRLQSRWGRPASGQTSIEAKGHAPVRSRSTVSVGDGDTTLEDQTRVDIRNRVSRRRP